MEPVICCGWGWYALIHRSGLERNEILEIKMAEFDLLEPKESSTETQEPSQVLGEGDNDDKKTYNQESGAQQEVPN